MLLRGKKIVCSSASLLLSGIVLSGYIADPVVMATTISEHQQSKANLQSRKKELSRELQAAMADVQKEAKNKDLLDKQIEVVQNQIDISNNYINALDDEINDTQTQISEIRENMKSKITLLKKSLSSLYVAGDTSTLDIVLGAKDFEDFLDKADIVRSVSRTIKKLIDDLQSDLEEIQNKEKKILEDKKEQETERESLEKSRNDLQGLFDESEKLLAEYQESEQNVKRRVDQNDAEIKAIDSQIQRYYEEQRRKQEEEAKKRAQQGKPPVPDKPFVPSGKYIWPVPGFHYISSGFSDTQDRSHVHGAVDIAGRGIYGARIVAPAAGRVIMANSVVDAHGRGGGGYGKYVVIDCGNGISFLMGHMSSVAVSIGQTVSQGECIGNVGNTGFSTGPHVHVEARNHGVRINPLSILG